jgi:hypothetical protein
MWGALSDERTGLPFTIAAGPHQLAWRLRRELHIFPLQGMGANHLTAPFSKLLFYLCTNVILFCGKLYY